MHKIYGHDAIIQRLVRSINLNKTDRAWIFSGISGIGKATIAYRFAAYILAETSTVDLDPDNILSIFSMVQNGTHPDFFTIDNELETATMEDYRNIVAKLYKKPVLSNHRVLLINDAEKLNINIFNALLKLFEEPPHNTAIIMITDNSDVIPATLKSRCACLNFMPLSFENIRKAIAELNEQITDTEIAISNGSIGDAIRLKGDQMYTKYLQAISGRHINIPEYNINEDWWKLKKYIIRYLTVALNLSLKIDCDLSESEKKLIHQYDADNLAKTAHEIMKMMSLTDSMQLDKSTFLRWHLEQLSLLRSGFESK